ncbi:putative glycolipid-binding domain-containing protein [Chryseobacterium lathyri]|jgi:hypothetical protein|uniref:Glycolipid-binding domain-containing protein n=1 Tax=Chryseobacterium lathyri TaxID=395933 RepID=A0A511Y8C2_9FLAO|nr:putative glycolipid-binding domain-containing protein [Chryseobacterium lathyri]GEN71452.1 hypothetical protein CLA01_15240 [Chryseobacterium lathyri]
MKIILWKGLANQSLEYFKIEKKEGSLKVNSKILGIQEDTVFAVTYHLLIDDNWFINEFTIVTEINSITTSYTGKKRDCAWEINNIPEPELANIHYIDISLSPFTNSLPINNLVFKEKVPQDIDVIYIDILQGHIKPVKQRYTKLDTLSFSYENIDSDFKAILTVDHNGFVEEYPELFEKIGQV